MKNNIITFKQLGIVSVCVAALCASGVASAQNPPPFPKSKPTATAAADSSDQTQSSGQTKASGGAQSKASSAKGGSSLSAADKKFMMNAAKGGMMEVEGGKVAAQNATNADVKKFGNKMVSEHGKANNELMGIAKSKGVSLPSSGHSMKWKSDKDYMQDMVKDHTKDLAEFQKEAKEGSDPDVKKFAEKGSKMVSKHLEMAKNINGKLK